MNVTIHTNVLALAIANAKAQEPTRKHGLIGRILKRS